MGKFVDKYTEIYFFDDKAENIDVVKTAWPKVMTYFMQRQEDKLYAHILSTCECADSVTQGLDGLSL